MIRAIFKSCLAAGASTLHIDNYENEYRKKYAACILTKSFRLTIQQCRRRWCRLADKMSIMELTLIRVMAAYALEWFNLIIHTFILCFLPRRSIERRERADERYCFTFTNKYRMKKAMTGLPLSCRELIILIHDTAQRALHADDVDQWICVIIYTASAADSQTHDVVLIDAWLTPEASRRQVVNILYTTKPCLMSKREYYFAYLRPRRLIYWRFPRHHHCFRFPSVAIVCGVTTIKKRPSDY